MGGRHDSKEHLLEEVTRLRQRIIECMAIPDFPLPLVTKEDRERLAGPRHPCGRYSP
jgi:hypothetical protein